MTSLTRLMVFCKAPIAGEVKTRLTPEFSPGDAADIHRQLASETINDVLALSESAEVKIELWCSPNCDHEFFQSYVEKGIELKVQSGADLGVRMYNGFASADGPAILIGTDCPPVNERYLTVALARLASSDMVIGPAEDGGYGLIGLHQANQRLFQEIQWSTEKVLNQTLCHSESQRLRVALLPKIWDVDLPADVKRWRSL